MIENNIQVKLDRFDGPLSLLLHLIQRDEMSIRDLDLTQITKQYLDYLNLMKELNFDVAGEYLYMASSLLHLKSKTCLIEEEAKIKELLGEEEIEFTSKSQLIEKLEELDRFRKLGEKLWGMDKKGHEIFLKPKVNRKAIQNSILAPMEMQSLVDAMIDIIRREKKKYTVVRRDRISIKEKLVTLKNTLRVGVQAKFDDLLNNEKEGIDDIVITFISLLELARLKKINVFQNEDMGSIYVDVVDDLNNFDVETATGFENEEDLENQELSKALEQQLEENNPVEMTGKVDELAENSLEDDSDNKILQ